MDDLKEIRHFIVARGYEQIATFSHGKRDLLYKKSNFGSPISIFLFLEFKPSAKAYSVHVGVENELAHACLAEVSGCVDQFLDSLLRECNFVNRPCWCFFDAGRALGWRSGFVVPDPLARDHWRLLMEQLFNEFVDPIFISIKHENALIELLSRNDKPFEWALSATVLRASEIIALCTLLGMTEAEIFNKINPFAIYIERQIAENCHVPGFVDKLVMEIRRSENLKSEIRHPRLS